MALKFTAQPEVTGGRGGDEDMRGRTLSAQDTELDADELEMLGRHEPWSISVIGAVECLQHGVQGK